MIPFLSFDYQLKLLRENLLNKTAKFLDSKYYVLGKEIENFEDNYASKIRSKYCVGISNGLDALTISLKALRIGRGDEVIVPSNTYIASWLAISQVGAKIVPVEPCPVTFNLDPNRIEEKISDKTRVIMPVHLYGQACNMTKIMSIAKKHSLYVIEDNAQAQLAKWDSQFTGTFGNINGTSFYPTKNLGAFGEAGCITTDSFELMNFAKAYRNYGSTRKYVNTIKGTNARLDELQAGYLNVKLNYLEKFTEERREIANYYLKNLDGIDDLTLPLQAKNSHSVFHLFVIRTKNRDALQKHLEKNGIGTSIHYPIPPHLQKAYTELNFRKGSFPIAEELAETSLSIPLYPGLKIEDQKKIINSIRQFFN